MPITLTSTSVDAPGYGTTTVGARLDRVVHVLSLRRAAQRYGRLTSSEKRGDVLHFRQPRPVGGVDERLNDLETRARLFAEMADVRAQTIAELRADHDELRTQVEQIAESISDLVDHLGATGDSVDDMEEWRLRVLVAVGEFGRIISLIPPPGERTEPSTGS